MGSNHFVSVLVLLIQTLLPQFCQYSPIVNTCIHIKIKDDDTSQKTIQCFRVPFGITAVFNTVNHLCIGYDGYAYILPNMACKFFCTCRIRMPDGEDNRLLEKPPDS